MSVWVLYCEVVLALVVDLCRGLAWGGGGVRRGRGTAGVLVALATSVLVTLVEARILCADWAAPRRVNDRRARERTG